MTTQRNPQLNLRLDTSEPDPAERWHDGATVAFLGSALTLHLGSASKDARREGDLLHLPLPPQATPRQIQDRAEAWLRAEAKRHLTQLIAQKSTLAARRTPQLRLSFALHGHWVEAQDSDTLRCNWRLIEQTPAVIDVTISRAIAMLPRPCESFDLFDIALA